MDTVRPFAAVLGQRLREAIATALPATTGADPQVRRSAHADFQADGILPLARPLRANPRELAARVTAALADQPATGELIARYEVSGPGFVNLTLADAAIWRQVASRLAAARLGVPAGDPGSVTGSASCSPTRTRSARASTTRCCARSPKTWSGAGSRSAATARSACSSTASAARRARRPH